MQPQPSNALSTVINEETISLMVDRFYTGVRQHETLGPVFNPRLEGRWERHLSQMKAFWSSVLLRTGTYQGFPLGAHFEVPGMEPEHFVHWLGLWQDTIRSIYTEPVAEAVYEAAREFARRFSYALFDQGYHMNPPRNTP